MSARVVRWEPGAEPLGRAVVAIGVFDGVHLGHRDILAHAVERGSAEGLLSVGVTFDRDPDQVVTPDSAAPQLLTLEDKVAVLADLGLDAVLVIGFTEELAQTPPDGFVTGVLLAAVDPSAVVVGRDFRFGRDASGDVETLRSLGDRHGFEVIAYELVRIGGEPVTSTRVRVLVAQGDVAGAARLLGRAHRVRGSVRRGRGVGAGLGFPTANVRGEAHAAVPADGVYAGFATVRGEAYPAAVSVGIPPSYPGSPDSLEAHLVGFEGDLTGEEIVLEFVDRLRDQRSFDSEQDLARAIAADVDETLDRLRS